MKRTLLFLIIVLISMGNMMSQEKEVIVQIDTDFGSIKLKLYNETPKHRDNFLKLIDEEFFKDLLFHRVIQGFMIQGGDPDSRTASDTALLGKGGLDYMVDAEFRLPQHYHRRGVLAAARKGDDVNPERASSASQFYIVTGHPFTDKALDKLEQDRYDQLVYRIKQRVQADSTAEMRELYKSGDKEALQRFRDIINIQIEEEAEARREEVLFNEEQRDVYKVIGGAPRLDGAYTVFGEVLEGMTVVDQIEQMKTNQKDRPLQNVRMNIIRLKE